MSLKINFINPFGTKAYDDLILETLSHFASPGTKLDVTHLDACPADMDYFYPKHFVEASLLEAIKQSEEDGYDAVICGCCYDPAVMTARELVNIPVIGPMEAAINLLSYYGRTAVIVTDHVKAGSLMKAFDGARSWSGVAAPTRCNQRLVNSSSLFVYAIICPSGEMVAE